MRALLLTMMVAATLACSVTTPRCLRSNCSGCCDESGACVAGTQSDACGAEGLSCNTCLGSSSCVAGACRYPDGGLATEDAGVVPSTDAGACTNCQGCCDNGRCRSGDLYAACGRDGMACVQCPQGQGCLDHQCRAYACPGCLASDGGCQLGSQSAACGIDGGTCVACAGSQICNKGQCTELSSCGPSSCSGCCSGLTCLSSPSGSQCGTGGAICSTCPAGQQCVSGACSTAPTGGGAGGGGGSNGCDFLSCDGCCQGSSCMPGTAGNACGVLGNDCKVCDHFCISGFCI